MKTIEEAAKQYGNMVWKEQSRPNSSIDFKAGVEFAQRWIPMNELKDEGVEYIFKNKNGKCSVGKFEFIESKLCITTEIGYSLMEDSGFTHFRPIELK